MKQTEHISYLELPASNLEASKTFFKRVFGWTFQDYGPDYTSFKDASLQGGFYQANLMSRAKKGSALIVFYSPSLVKIKKEIEQAGGEIIQDIFEFPGGCRFHFLEPSGNEFAVWSETV